MQKAEKGQGPELSGVGLHIGIVQARFNADITDALADACKEALLDLGVQEENITLVQVPGALEVPMGLMALAERDEFDALVAWGASFEVKLTTLNWLPMNRGPVSPVSGWTMAFQLPTRF